MSWDVIVGTGNYGCSACKVFKVPGSHNISENSVSFWIHDVYLGLDLVIFKNTNEGYLLDKMIKDNESLEIIMSFLEDVILRYVPSKILKSAVRTALENAYKDGKHDKAKQIVSALFDQWVV